MYRYPFNVNIKELGNQESIFLQNLKNIKLGSIWDCHFIIGYSNTVSNNTIKLKCFKSSELIHGDPFNSVTTDGQILNTTIELFLEIKHLDKLFTKSTFKIFAHLHMKLKYLQLQLQILC